MDPRGIHKGMPSVPSKVAATIAQALGHKLSLLAT